MPGPRIGKDVRVWVRATQVRNADSRVDIVAMFGLGNGGVKLYGTIIIVVVAADTAVVQSTPVHGAINADIPIVEGVPSIPHQARIP